jgi:hypothetical protein
MEATVENIGVAVVENAFAKNLSRQFRQVMLSISGDQLQNAPRRGGEAADGVGRLTINFRTFCPETECGPPRPVRFKSVEGTMLGRRPYLAKVGERSGFPGPYRRHQQTLAGRPSPT